MKSILLVKKLLGLAEMTFGLVTASFSLPEGQAVKMIFFARCINNKFVQYGTRQSVPYKPKLKKFYKKLSVLACE